MDSPGNESRTRGAGAKISRLGVRALPRIAQAVSYRRTSWAIISGMANVLAFL